MPRIFENHHRHLWSVLGALARRGFVAQPDEAGDLLHDFYAGEWEKVCDHYDPKRGPFKHYLVKSFFQFARRRIARDYSRKKRMLEFAGLADIRDAPSVDEV